MIRVIYRWRVGETDIKTFKSAWERTTTAIRTSTPGARGSMLLQSRQDPGLFFTIARWNTVEAWEAFWKVASPEAMEEMHAVAQRLSADVYEEIEDHTI